MINIIWLFLLASGIVYAGWQGNIDIVTKSALNSADAAVVLSLKLVGVMSLWLGIMKIAENAGVIKFLCWLLGPIIKLLFPSVPKNHPAMGAIIMTLSANMLGMGNATTPLGIKAMQELQKLNSHKDTASASMCTLLALCTAGFTLVPATVIALRSAAGSINPTEIVGPNLVVSFVATFAVITLDRVFRFFCK